MANVGKFLLVLLAIVGLYALPNIVSDCPEGREWSCVDRLAPAVGGSGDALLVAVSPDGERVAVLGETELNLWSLESSELIDTIDIVLPNEVAMLDGIALREAAIMLFTADGSELLVASASEGDADRDAIRLDLAGVVAPSVADDELQRIEDFDDSRLSILDGLSDGELTVQTVDGDWFVDIDTTLHWTARTASFTEARSDAFIVLRAESSVSLPRILRKHPSRIQILDIDEQDVTMDIDLPSEVVDAQWSQDGDHLVAVDADGVLTIFAREADR